MIEIFNEFIFDLKIIDYNIYGDKKGRLDGLDGENINSVGRYCFRLLANARSGRMAFYFLIRYASFSSGHSVGGN